MNPPIGPPVPGIRLPPGLLQQQPPGGLRGPLASFSWSSPTDLQAKYPGGILQLPKDAAIVCVEPGHGGSGYILGWGGGGGSPVAMTFTEGDAFPCGAAPGDQAQLLILGTLGSGAVLLTIWDYHGGIVRAQSVGGGSFVTLHTTQTVDGRKTFTNTLIEGEPEYQPRVFTPDSNKDGIARGPFQESFGGALFNATWDNVLASGYNFNGDGGQVLGGEAAFADFLETDYESSPGVHVMERYWQFKNNNGAINLRPVFVQVDRTTGACIVDLAANGANGFVSMDVSGNQCVKVQNGATLNMNGQIEIFVGTGARNMIKFLDFAGGSFLTLVKVKAADVIAFNDVNAFQMGENSNKLGFFGTAPQVQPTINGSRGGNAALADLLTKGAGLGLWVDGTVP